MQPIYLDGVTAEQLRELDQLYQTTRDSWPPKVTDRLQVALPLRYAGLELPKNFHAAPTHGIGYNLKRMPAQANPEHDRLAFFCTKDQACKKTARSGRKVSGGKNSAQRG